MSRKSERQLEGERDKNKEGETNRGWLDEGTEKEEKRE